jgi:soluble lytic murein transglycosylase-like protein
MNPWLVVAAVVAVVLWSRRGAAVNPRRGDSIFDYAVQTAQAAGVDPAVFLGIIEVESAWKPNATNLIGPDGARGGAFGLTQMTLRTAQGLRPGITGEELLDPRTNLDVAGQLLAENARRISPLWPDVAAAWNSGRSFDTAPERTRYDYVPKVLAAANRYATNLDLDLGDAEGEV